MALLKPIELENGVVINYHRIVSIYKITNHSTRIEVAGYINAKKRLQEQEQIENGESINVYMTTDYICADYDETSTIKDWYDYLKTTDKYIGAEDDE